MSDEEDKGGIVLGGISFGVGPEPKPTAKADAATPGSSTQAKQPVELGDHLMPLRVIAAVDLVPRGEFNAGAHPPEGTIRVTPGALDELFTRIAPRLAIEVESVLRDGQKVRVDFAPTSLKSFRPDSLAQDLPLLRALLDGRKVLERLREGSGDVDAARHELNRIWEGSALAARVLGGVAVQPAAPAPTAPAAPSGGDDDVMRILDMVGGGDDDSQAAGSPAPAATPAPAASGGGSRFGAFIAAVAHSGKANKGVRPDEAIAMVDQAIGLQLGAILQHPELRRLEEAWRGVDQLLAATPKQGVILEVVSVSEDQLLPALTKAIDTSLDAPASLAIVDAAIDGSAATLGLLRQLGELAESRATPIIANATAGLLGHDDLAGIDRLDNKQALFDAPERAPWRAEANKPAMLWVSLALNRVLARQGYDKRTSRLRGTEVAEAPNDREAAYVWTSPCFAVGTLIMKSFEKTGWPCRITGARDGMVENLPVYETEAPGTNERIALPLEAFFSTETQKSLARLGVLALASQPNDDKAYLLTAATAYVPPPKRTYDYDSAEDQVRLPQASLVDQLFVARLAQYLQALGERIGSDNPKSEIEEVVKAATWELFHNAAPPGPEIEVAMQDAGGRLTAAVTVRPRRYLGVSLEELTLGVPLS